MTRWMTLPRWARICAGLWLFAVNAPLAYAFNEDIQPDEQVVFFNTAGWRADNGDNGADWNLPIHGWIFEPEDSVVRKSVVAEALDEIFDISIEAAHVRNFDRRVNLFLADNERGKHITIELGGQRFTLPESTPSGHFSRQLRLPARAVEPLSDADGWVHFRTIAPDGRRFEGRVQLIEPRGLSVISDIDDTVKITDVTHRRALLENTFLRDFRAVPGMVEKYAEWAARDVRFHFVSSSPWQLYPPLCEFMQRAGFPEATYALKAIRFTDRSLLNLFRSGTETKPAQIEPLLHAYPHRRFVLIGDSGEEDAAVYAMLMRRYPDQIVACYIRVVGPAGVSRDSVPSSGTNARQCVLFSDPSTLAIDFTGRRLKAGPSDRAIKGP